MPVNLEEANRADKKILAANSVKSPDFLARSDSESTIPSESPCPYRGKAKEGYVGRPPVNAN